MDLHKILILMFALVVVVMLVIMLVVVLNKTKNVSLKTDKQTPQNNENNQSVENDSKNNAEKEAVAEFLEDTELTEKEQLEQPETTVEPAINKDDTNEQEAEDKPAKPATKPTARYHVSQNKDQNSPHYKRWRVRKQGSQKTIKYFNTQKEAITHAEELSKNAGSSVVIHKKTGQIRK